MQTEHIGKFRDDRGGGLISSVRRILSGNFRLTGFSLRR
jgi:hypothetical protein